MYNVGRVLGSSEPVQGSGTLFYIIYLKPWSPFANIFFSSPFIWLQSHSLNVRTLIRGLWGGTVVRVKGRWHWWLLCEMT